MSSRSARRFLTPAILLAALLAGGLQQGCYKRVVGVRGLGGSTYDVSEPYQQNSPIDDWVFGERVDPNNKVKAAPAPRE